MAISNRAFLPPDAPDLKLSKAQFAFLLDAQHRASIKTGVKTCRDGRKLALIRTLEGHGLLDVHDVRLGIGGKTVTEVQVTDYGRGYLALRGQYRVPDAADLTPMPQPPPPRIPRDLRMAPPGAVRSRWSIEEPQRKAVSMRMVLFTLANTLKGEGDMHAEIVNTAGLTLDEATLAKLWDATREAELLDLSGA